MAIVKSVNAFRYFLYNRHFVILSDSKSLEKYKSTTSPVDLTTKWLIDLYTYDFTFKYIKGQTNVLADYFSREIFDGHSQNLSTNPELIPSILPIETNSPRVELHQITGNKSQNICNVDIKQTNVKDLDMQISTDTFFKEQRNNKDTLKIINNITSDKPAIRFKNYFIHPDNGLLMIKKKFIHPENSKHAKIVVPASLKAKVSKISHMPHFGIFNTYRRALKNFY